MSENHGWDQPGASGEGSAASRDDARRQNARGSQLIAEQKYAEAEAAYREAVRLDPRTAKYHDDLGNTLFAQEKYADAAAAYREALKLGPGNVLYEYNLRNALSLLAGRSKLVTLGAPGSQGAEAVRVPSLEFGILGLEFNGSWSVDALIRLLNQLEQAYFSAAALESLAEPWTIGIISVDRPQAQTADELIQAVAAFRLGGGLQIRSLHYGSAGIIEVIGALKPLKTVKDGITENREINLKREDTRLSDERERQKQSAEHAQAMKQEHRDREQMHLKHEREMAKLQIEAEATRVQSILSVIDRLAPEQRTAAAASLLQVLARNTESIANDARLGEVKMLDVSE